MAAHSTLTGADLHEPKGAAAATSGQVYVADGAASGAWNIPFVTTAALNNNTLVAVTYKFEDVSTASSQWVACPIAGDISKIYSVLHGAIGTADAVFSFEIAGVAVTSGGLTIAFSGSAAGDLDSATPSAAKTLTAGQAIEIIGAGASTNTVNATFTFLINTA